MGLAAIRYLETEKDEFGNGMWLFFEQGEYHRPIMAVDETQLKSLLERQGYTIVKKEDADAPEGR